MPVLPDVASISVSPGLMSPRFSASTIIESAGRSLTDPAGLLPSSLPSTTLVVAPGSRCRRTSGVLPTVEASVAYMRACRDHCSRPLRAPAGVRGLSALHRLNRISRGARASARRRCVLRLACRGSSTIALGGRHFALRRARRRLLCLRLDRGLERRGAADGEIGLELLEALCADALDLLQLLDGLERPVRLAIVEDRLRLRGTDAGKRDELVLCRRVDVDRAERHGRDEQEPERERKPLHGNLRREWSMRAAGAMRHAW